MNTVVMPAGKYFVGDPSHALTDIGWQEVITDTDFFNDHDVDFRGVPVWAASTAHGDGCYEGSDGGSYPVDRGMIGVIPVSIMDETVESMDGEYGRVVEFASPFECSSLNGDITIGDITIITDPEDEDECCPECDALFEECICDESDDDEYDDD